MAEHGSKITAEAQVPESPIGTPILNAPEVSWSSTHSFVSNPPSPPVVKFNHLFYFPCPSFDSFLFSTASKIGFHSFCSGGESFELTNNRQSSLNFFFQTLPQLTSDIKPFVHKVGRSRGYFPRMQHNGASV